MTYTNKGEHYKTDNTYQSAQYKVQQEAHRRNFETCYYL